jgi:hypothetical protein
MSKSLMLRCFASAALMLCPAFAMPAVPDNEVPHPLLQGCRPTETSPTFSADMIRNNARGRALLNIERSKKGWLSVTNVAKSEPGYSWGKVAIQTFRAMRCTPLSEPMQGTVSITYTLGQASAMPHFPEADTTLDVKETIERRP